MNEKLKLCLEHLKSDYAKHMGNGQPFKHFYCPILLADEDTELIQAHVVNKSFPDIPRQWTVQRADVDNFYGSHFESEFTKLQYVGTDIIDVLSDKSLWHKLSPKVWIDGRSVEIYPTQGNIPKSHTLIRDEDTNQLYGIKMKPEEIQEKISNGKSLEIGYEKDPTLETIVSSIKAAHLTLFYLKGYDYAKTSGSVFVGHNILGKFYLQNQNENNREKVRENAVKFFDKYKQMVRPVAAYSNGSVNNNIVLFCFNSNNTIWAMIVYVYIGGAKSLNAVLMPYLHNFDSVITFNAFLKFGGSFEYGIYNLEKNKWIDQHRYPIKW